MSRLVDWTDRGTCILFGDGAGAAVLKAAEGRAYLPVSHSDGKKGEALTCDRYIHMDGRAVFQFAVTRVPEVIREVLTKNDCSWMILIILFCIRQIGELWKQWQKD